MISKKKEFISIKSKKKNYYLLIITNQSYCNYFFQVFPLFFSKKNLNL